MAKAGLKPGRLDLLDVPPALATTSSSTTSACRTCRSTVCVDRAGFVGDDGKTHQGIYDIAYTRGIPNMTVAAPKDENELQHLLYTAIGSGRPFTIRYPRGVGLGVPLDDQLREIPVGKGEILSSGRDLNLLAYGSMVPVAEKAAEALRGQGIDCGRRATPASPSRSTSTLVAERFSPPRPAS